MFSSKSIDMLHGPLLKNIVAYTIPIMLTNVLQLLFNAADLMIVGRFCGSECVGAVGATTSLTHLITNLFIGISVGVGVTCAISIGSDNKEVTHKIVHTSIPVALICGVVVTLIGMCFSTQLLDLMNTPKEFIHLSDTYLKIYFSGTTAVMLYNFCASILRAAGDTKTPFLFLTIAGLLNFILNLIFVTFFDMDVDGVALATVISQVISAILVLWALIKRKDSCKLQLNKIKIYKKPLRDMLRIGIPSGIQSSLFSISNVLIQSSINSLGPVVVSGNAAASSLEGFIWVSMNSLQQTSLNFTGQNLGVKNYKRISQILKLCLLCVTVVGLAGGLSFYIFSKPLLSLYITDSAEAISAGVLRMSFICAPYFLAGIMDVVSGSIRGMGVSLPPMIITVLGVCVFRVAWVLTIFKIPEFHTAESLYISYPISWIITFTALIFVFIHVLRKNINKTEKE